jgi:KDO2-lipid IV(A) lauroyltransferase
MLCGPHLSNFNLAFLAFALREMPLQVLMTAAPGGYQLVEALLNRHEVHATQISMQSLREALTRLRSGGMVLTGVDWPQAPGETEDLPFFGRPARLPVGHVRLALSTGAAILPVAVRWDPGTGYRLITATPIVPEPGPDRGQVMRETACRVLAVLEKWIAERPEQWLMYYPVWPLGATSGPARRGAVSGAG